MARLSASLVLPTTLRAPSFFQVPLPASYWVEGLHTATYLLNRLPTKTLASTTTYFALFGLHLCVFGCACYPNLSSTAPHKLSPRSTLCVFLGYFSDHKGFRGLDLSSNRVIVARHVTFDETSFPLAKSWSPAPTDDFDFLVEFEPQVRLIGLCVASGRASRNHGCASCCPHHASPSVSIPWARYITQVYTHHPPAPAVA